MIQDELEVYEELLTKVDSEDRRLAQARSSA